CSRPCAPSTTRWCASSREESWAVSGWWRAGS
ncbi:uncharacterized protein METZ01_LOCUS12774, partial [marine metagenome]